MKRTKLDILEELLCEKREFSGEGSLKIDNTVKDMQLSIIPSGNSRQATRSGKNKLKLTQVSETKNGLVISVDNGKIIINGTATVDTQILIYEDSNGFSVNGDYYFSTNVQNPLTDTDKYTWINIYNVSTQLGYLNTMSDGKQINFENQTITRITFSIKAGAVCNNLTFEFQLEEGSTATEYEQYGAMPSPDYKSEVETLSGSVEIDICNKNLFDKNMGTEKFYYDSSGNKIQSDYETINQKIKVKQNTTYNISFKNRVGNANLRFCEFKKDATFITRTLINTKGAIVTTNSETDYIIVSVENSSNDYFNELQIEESSNATSYISHESYSKTLPLQKEFVKMGDVEDTFVKQNGKWYEKHYIPKKIFNGNEGWQKSSRTDVNRYYIPIIIDIKLDINNIMIISNLFKGIPTSNSDLGQQGVAGYNYSGLMINVDLDNADLDTLEKFKTFLNNNNLITYYISNTPELLECTEEQSTILDELQTLLSYDEVTNITCLNELPCNIKATTKINKIKELETVVNNLSNAIVGGN